MVLNDLRLAVLCLSLAVAIAACGETRPYVYKWGEFDRGSDTFNKEPEDRDSVTICYNKLGTTPEVVFELASTECGKYAKRARPTHQGYGDCPIATPVEAHFACDKSLEGVQGFGPSPSMTRTRGRTP